MTATPDSGGAGMAKAGRACIYALTELDGEIRYIGKANDIKARAATHRRDAGRRSTPLANWVRARGRFGVIHLATAIGDWRELEREMIAQYRADGFRLLNLADGGDQPSQTLEQRQRNGRAAAKARVSGPDARATQLKQYMGVAIAQAKKKGEFDSPFWLELRDKLSYAAFRNPRLFGKWADL